mgnify:CR=1 FL=1
MRTGPNNCEGERLGAVVVIEEPELPFRKAPGVGADGICVLGFWWCVCYGEKRRTGAGVTGLPSSMSVSLKRVAEAAFTAP